MGAPLRLLLDSHALVVNWRWLAAQQPNAATGAAVKADGYGLGARAVAKHLGEAGCRDFFVATWAEAVALGAVAGSLSVLHGVRADDLATAVGHSARPVLNSVGQALRWKAAGGGACDVMVDTGMNRLGLTPQEAVSGVLDGLEIETLMSHLACADEPGHALNARQSADFRALVGRIPAKRASLSNSAGILLGADYGFDLTRPGIALYGGDPAPGVAMQRVVTVAAEVLQVRLAEPGTSVGYGATWVADAPTRIAIVNLGYADGVLRALGDSLTTMDGDPVVGRISMDLIAVALGERDAGEGDWLEFPFDLPRLAEGAGLSQYELLTGLNDRFERFWS